MGRKTYNGGGTILIPGTGKERDTGQKDDPHRPQDVEAGRAYRKSLNESHAAWLKSERERKAAEGRVKHDAETTENARDDTSLTLLKQGTEEWTRANYGRKQRTEKKSNARKAKRGTSRATTPRSGGRAS